MKEADDLYCKWHDGVTYYVPWYAEMMHAKHCDRQRSKPAQAFV